MRLRSLFCLCLLSMGLPVLAASKQAYVDPLDAPSTQSALAVRSSLVGLAHAGQRLVTVGEMGHILFSDDGGGHWSQASVPVSTDLVAVAFADDTHGWAVGHDGVILHSEDAGSTWQRQMDGRQLIELIKKHYANPALDARAKAQAEHIVEQAEAAAPAFTFLDVWFRDRNEGFAVGAFNLLLHTDDAGKTWEPWFDHADNPHDYHIYSVSGDANGVYLSGELGLLLRLNRANGIFEALSSPYQGSFFGVLVKGDELLAFGLRGNAFRSVDAGQHWQTLQNPSGSSSLVDAIWLADGSALLLDQAGNLLHGDSASTTLRAVGQAGRVPSNALISSASGILALAGPFGVRQQSLK
ncbi:YCF48-related protein [Pseudomonas citronellolis]|uniref:YCF48-related protein n=1 Tax=Pseudomonas citronellolis TaxID=53408 RepID=A0AAW6P662_9PSED|nr:YCF48-related protein [Pseudomonas citronellolis]MDF3842953.1 YCF48-related protein [Pseudomonas citronellolis]